MKRRIVLVCCGALWCGVVAPVRAADTAATQAAPGAERLLLGFEADELARVAEVLKTKLTASKSPDGAETVTLEAGADIGRWKWVVYQGNASQGRSAVGLRPTREALYLDQHGDLPPESPLAQLVPYYGLWQDNWAAMGGSVFHTSGAFRRIFPKDWSGYDVLRLDVFCEGVGQTVRVLREDEEIGPPISRGFSVPPGRWTTLEVDLRAADGLQPLAHSAGPQGNGFCGSMDASRLQGREPARPVRGLDLTRMATLTVGIVKTEVVAHPPSGVVDSPPGAGAPHSAKPYTALLDNLRLARKGAPAKLPVLRDETPLDLPAFLRGSTTPEPERMPPGTPDRAPLTLGEPIRVDMDRPAFLAPVGFVAAYDNAHLLVGFNRQAPNVFALQSADGGATWRGLDGQPAPAQVRVPEITHQCGWGDVVGTRSDAILLTNIGCNGPSFASLRLFAQKLTFTGAGWTLRPTPALVDADLRHCNSNQSIVRTADGRLWAAYGLVGRLGTQCINLRYSDDDGLTWRPSRDGTSGVIPASVHSDAGGASFGYYTFEEPCIVPWEKGVACFWQEREGYNYGPLKWARFDGKAWSAVETIPEPKRMSYNPTRPPVRAVSVGAREVFLVSALFDGVLHYADGRWAPEAVEIPAGSRISLAGGRTVVVVAAVGEGVNLRESADVALKKAPVTLRAWQRRGDGTWSGPVTLAREETPLASADGQYCARPGFVVQPYAPPNFVPVAWSCGQRWIKVLRAPVGDAAAADAPGKPGG